MLQKICIKTSEIVLVVLAPQTEIRSDIICNPQAYFSTIHRVISGVVGIVAAHNLLRDKNKNRTLENVFGNLEHVLNSDCVFPKNFKQLSTEEKKALHVFFNWFQNQNFGKISLSDLYELMLSLDFPIGNRTIVKGYENEIENTIGSFYTPKELADKCVELTLDRYIFQNTGIERFSEMEKNEEQIGTVSALLMKSSFADYACGTGSFLLAIIRYLKKHFSKNENLLRQIAKNMVAIEADSLALEVAKLEVLTAINAMELYPEISKNFIHGNPLLKPNGTSVSSVFSDTFYYHNNLAIDPKQLLLCDLIFGNPPWGNVGFDYDYFFHTIHPKLQKIEDEEELIRAVEELETTHPKLYDWFLLHETANDLAAEQIYEDERFQNSHMGGLNTNALFTELTDSLCSERGVVCLVLKTTTLSDPVNRKLLRHLKDRKRIMARYDFINSNRIFNIDTDEKISVIVLGIHGSINFDYSKNLTRVGQVI